MFNYLKQKNKSKLGFTLVETLVAISIFSISIISLLSVLAKGIIDINYAESKVTASYLAEEGIEYIRNMRDTYVVNDVDPATGWSDFLTKMNICKTTVNLFGCKFSDNLASYDFATINSNSMSISSCADIKGTNCPLSYGGTGRYYYSVVNDPNFSGFTRVIKITPNINPNGDEIKVTSTVTWTKNASSFTVSFSDNLSKWWGR